MFIKFKGHFTIFCNAKNEKNILFHAQPTAAGTKNVLKVILGSKNHSIQHAIAYFYIFRRLIATSSSMLRLVAFKLHLALITFSCLIARQEKAISFSSELINCNYLWVP